MHPKPVKLTKEEKLQLKLNKLKEKKKELSISDLKKKVQRVFNEYIRNRDKDQPCISCQKRSNNYHAGHYIAQGSSGFLRFEPLNVHAQCPSCNLFKHGNLINYRVNLVKKIGETRVRWLEDNRVEVKKWTREELNELFEKYK